jgi:lanthanide-dependent methanol dehydrogenase
MGTFQTILAVGGGSLTMLSGVSGSAGIGLAAGLTDPHAGLDAVGGYAVLSNYTSLGGQLTVFGLPQ